MRNATEHTVRFCSMRPLVRYVDEEQAVIDVHLSVAPAVTVVASPHGGRGVESIRSPSVTSEPCRVTVLIEVRGGDGFTDEQLQTAQLSDGQAMVRFQIVHPQRWWPMGMGEQSLYELTVRLLGPGDAVQTRTVTVGLTSVRAQADEGDGIPRLLINGRQRRINSVVPIDLRDERRMLPVAGDALLLVRGHYGPEVLYQAADRAGALVVQSVPIDPDGCPERQVMEQIDRLAAHPSLAGWFVGHLGDLAGQLTEDLRRADPTHAIFRRIPQG